MQNSTEEKHTGYYSGVALLTVSTALVKLIGFFCKIPLLSLLGSEGMGYYNSAYEIYTLFAVISTSGLPSAMTVLTHDNQSALRVCRSAYRLMLPFAIIGTVIMFLLADKIALAINNPMAAPCIRAISPGVLFITVNGILKGYFQSRKRMMQTAVAQVIEALSKLVVGICAAYLAFVSRKTSEWVSSAAIIGITFGTILSSIYLIISKRVFSRALENSDREKYTKNLLKLAFPITLSASLSSFLRLADTTLILHRLQDIGIDLKTANSMYGAYSTLTLPLFALVPAFITAVALPLVPQIVEYIRTDNGLRMKQLMNSAIGITAFAAIPVAIGFATIPSELLNLLFRNQQFAVNTASPLLRLIALSLLPSCLITLSNAILYAYGKNIQSFTVMLFGTAIKVISEYILIGIPSVGLAGAVISTVICDIVIICINFTLIYKYSGYIPNFTLFTKPLFAASVGMFSAIVIGKITESYIPVNLSTLLKIAITAIIYTFLVIITGAVPDEIKEKGLILLGKRRKNTVSQAKE